MLYSGLADRLAEMARISILTTQPSSAAFASLGDIPVHAVPACHELKVSRRIQAWNRKLHEDWIDDHGPGVNDGSIARGCDGGQPRWLRTLSSVEATLARASSAVKSWQQFYEDLGLDCIIAMDFASPRVVTALQAARLSGVTTIVLTNSWKDVYAHPYLPSPPNWIGVPGEPQAAYLRRANPGFQGTRVTAVGSLHLEPFHYPGTIVARSQFCEARRLDPSRPFICYTAASPSVVRDEEAIVATLLDEVGKHPAQPQVLLRLNPREDGGRFEALTARFSQLRIDKPRWEWNAAGDWNAPLLGDVDQWVATVFHSAFNVSIPSTVTLEFTVFGRLTLNVCYDAGGDTVPQQSNRRFWDAPFYREVRDSPLVSAAFSEGDLRQMLAYRLAEPGAWMLAPRRSGVSPVESAERLVRTALAAKLSKVPIFGKQRTVQVSG